MAIGSKCRYYTQAHPQGNMRPRVCWSLADSSEAFDWSVIKGEKTTWRERLLWLRELAAFGGNFA